MKIKVEKCTIFDFILFMDISLQLMLLMCGTLRITHEINFMLHMNMYIVVFLIIVVLILKGGMDDYLGILFFTFYLVFLMGQKLFVKDKNVFLTFSRTVLDVKQYFTFLTIMSFGLIITYISYRFFRHRVLRKAINNTCCIKDASPILPVVRLIFWGTMPLALYMQLKIVLVRSSISYVTGYTMNVYIPVIIKIAYYLFTSFSMIYLAMKPPKKEVISIIMVFLFINGGMQLFQGRRAFFASTLFFSIWYLIKDYYSKKISIKYILATGIGMLLLIVLFFFVEMKRDGVSGRGYDLFYIIEKFMISTGGSDSVIANTISKVDQFPKNGIWYLIDPIVNNPITIILTGKSGIGQGSDHRENFNNFPHWISYLTESSLYISGHGMGSCYLAEVYLTWGRLGVFSISIFIGYFISYMSKIRLDGFIFRNSIIFIMVQNLFTLPRSGLMGWFSDFTYLLIAFFIIYPFYNIYCKEKIMVNK